MKGGGIHVLAPVQNCPVIRPAFGAASERFAEEVHNCVGCLLATLSGGDADRARKDFALLGRLLQLYDSVPIYFWAPVCFWSSS